MPFRAKLSASLDESDLSMLDEVLARAGADEKSREHYAAMLIQLFQSGVTDPDELLRRIEASP